MLNNKKTCIRLFALVLALLMTVAIFAGCKDKAALEQAAAAQSQAEAANKAAADAQAAANDAAKVAEELKAALDSANAAADSAKDAAAAAKDEADKAQSQLQSHLGETKKDDSISEGDYTDATKYVTASILAELSRMKVDYLNLKQLWYTDADYIKLAKLFDDASLELYRATTADGVKDVLTKLSADAAAVPNIKSDVDAIQAQIAAFGDVDSNIFTTNEALVENARADYISWLEKYPKFFQAYGLDTTAYKTAFEKIAKGTATAEQKSLVASVDTRATASFGISVGTVKYAEGKLVVLDNYADKVALAAYNAISTILDKANTFDNIKGTGKIADIESAYNLYKIFYVANGGDDTPIEYVQNPGTKDAKTLLTGEQFVKQYVIVLYDNWFSQYQTIAKNFVNSLPTFFMNQTAAGAITGIDNFTGDLTGLDTTYLGTSKSTDEQVRNELEKVATLNNAEFLKWTFSGSFKGTLSLADSFKEIDRYVEKAAIGMANLFYTKVNYPAQKAQAEADAALVLSTLVGETDTFYKNADEAEKAAIKAIFTEYDAAAAKVTMVTYDDLNTVAAKDKTKKNLEDLTLFTVADFATSAGNNVAATLDVTDGTSAFVEILKGLQATSATVGKTVGNVQEVVAEHLNFYAFKKELCKELEALVTYVNTDAKKANVNSILNASTNGKTTEVAKADWDALKTACTSIATEGKTAIMAMNYDNYAAETYQAKNSSGKALYYAAAAVAGNTINTTAKDRNALNIVVDKLVVAKNAATTTYASYADKMLAKFVDLFRTQITAYLDAAIAAQATYKVDGDKTTLSADIDSYTTYLKKLCVLTSAGINVKKFSLANNAVAAANLEAMETAGYKLEVVTANKVYNYHVTDLSVNTDAKVQADIIAGSTAGDTAVADSYVGLANAAVTKFQGYATTGASNVYTKFEQVRQLAYYKDNATNVEIKNLVASIKGEWDAKTSTWVIDPLYTYDYVNGRTTRYLTEVDAVAARMIADINKIKLEDKEDTYATATAAVAAILALKDHVQQTDAKKVAEDDYSFQVCYDRYYATDATFNPVYDWAFYTAHK